MSTTPTTAPVYVKIKSDDWTLFDKVMYGGLGYGPTCLPSNFFKLIIAILFPPLGEIINIIGDSISPEMPFITWDALKLLVKYENINRIVYSFVLTTMFYIPGLVYTLGNLAEADKIKEKQIETFINSRK
jgi:hypothetical protein